MEKKLVSYCLLTYNQINYIESALNSALSQTYSPMEIVVSDDCSTDGTFEKIQELLKNYRGPHTLKLFKNSTNLGVRENVNTTLYQRAKGEYILLAAGDDLSDCRRAEIYANYFEQFPDVMSISCLARQFQDDGTCLNPDALWNNKYSIYNLDDYSSLPYLFMTSGDSRAIRKDVVNKFEKLRYSRDEDIYLYFRSLLLGSVLYIRSPLVSRRIHENNMSGNYSSKSLISTMQQQMMTDLEFAYQKGFININEFNMAKSKVGYVVDHFKNYTMDPRKHFNVLFYRGLSHFLKLTRNYPANIPWQ